MTDQVSGDFNYFSTTGTAGNNGVTYNIVPNTAGLNGGYTPNTTGMMPNPYAIPVPPSSYPSVPYPFLPDLMTPEEREGHIEFIEQLMFFLQAILDENDIPNEGGTMDRSEAAVLEAVIDLGDTEIVIRPKI